MASASQAERLEQAPDGDKPQPERPFWPLVLLFCPSAKETQPASAAAGLTRSSQPRGLPRRWPRRPRPVPKRFWCKKQGIGCCVCCVCFQGSFAQAQAGQAASQAQEISKCLASRITLCGARPCVISGFQRPLEAKAEGGPGADTQDCSCAESRAPLNVFNWAHMPPREVWPQFLARLLLQMRSHLRQRKFCCGPHPAHLFPRLCSTSSFCGGAGKQCLEEDASEHAVARATLEGGMAETYCADSRERIRERERERERERVLGSRAQLPQLHFFLGVGEETTPHSPARTRFHWSGSNTGWGDDVRGFGPMPPRKKESVRVLQALL